MSSSTPFPVNTCLYFLFSLAICVCLCLSTPPHLTASPGCAESLIFPGSTLCPQPNTVLYQKVATPPCLVVMAALTSFLPPLPSFDWGLVLLLGGRGGVLKRERCQFSLESMWHTLEQTNIPKPQKAQGKKAWRVWECVC